MAALRIQRKRARGWRAPAGAIYVGRGSVWGNPFSVEDYGREWAIELYDRMINGGALGEAVASIYKYSDIITQNPNGLHQYHNKDYIREHLRGKNLMCWCRLDQECHADILLDVANEQ